MTVPAIGLYSGVVPDPNTQSAEDFSTNAVNWTNYQANTLGVDLNASIEQFNIDFTTVNGFADDAEASAVSAASSESIALSAANFKGVWANLSGALNIPSSVEHEGAVYLLLNNLADVTASEPGATADWINITGVKYVVPVAGAELSTLSINRLKTSDTFKYPIASTIQEGIAVTVAILETDKGITPQIDLQGGNSATNGTDLVTDNVTYDARFTGLDDAVCNGVDTWEF